MAGITYEDVMDSIVEVSKVNLPRRGKVDRRNIYVNTELPFHEDGKMNLHVIENATDRQPHINYINEMRAIMAKALSDMIDVRNRAINELSGRAMQLMVEKIHS